MAYAPRPAASGFPAMLALVPGLKSCKGVLGCRGGFATVGKSPDEKEHREPPTLVEELHIEGEATIAVVEDDPDSRGLLRRLLTQAGYRVLTYPSADAALEAANGEMEQLHVRLIVTDLAMPGTGGDMLIRVLKKHPRTASIPILVVTAYVLDAIGYRARVAGCDALIEKPFRSTELLAAVRRLLAASAGESGGALA